MPSPEELEHKLWDALKSERTVMLGLVDVEDGHTRPMTAQFEHERGPIWFFTSTDNAMVGKLDQATSAMPASSPRTTNCSRPWAAALSWTTTAR